MLTRLAMHHIRYQPQYPQAEKHPDKRGKPGQSFKDRDEHKCAQAQKKYPFHADLCLTGRLSKRRHRAFLHERRKINKRHDHGDHTGTKEHRHDPDRAYPPADPQHRGGHVPDRRPGPAGIGRNNDHAGKNEPVVPVLDELVKKGDHHDRGRQVIQDRGKEERGQRHDPQKRLLVFCRHDIGHNLKTAMRFH